MCSIFDVKKFIEKSYIVLQIVFWCVIMKKAQREGPCALILTSDSLAVAKGEGKNGTVRKGL